MWGCGKSVRKGAKHVLTVPSGSRMAVGDVHREKSKPKGSGVLVSVVGPLVGGVASGSPGWYPFGEYRVWL